MNLTWHLQTLRTRHRFTTAQGGVSEKQTIVVALAHDGVTGFGEIVPSTLYGQTLATSTATLEAARGLLGDDPFARCAIMDRLIAAHDGQRAALAGIDSALHDWAARRLGVPVWRLLGLERPRVHSVFTIGIAERAEVREKVREALAMGFDRLKVKVGVASDDETLSEIRAQFDGPLLMDANEAWQPAEAPARIRALAKYRPTMIEQPLRREDWPALRELRGLGVAPIFVDEDCQRPADVVRVAPLVDGVNIKFTKCGGICEALRMFALARGLGLRTMLGCFVSSGLAIAPALAIAGLAEFVDLDGHLLLAQDPFPGIERSGGTLSAPLAPGLGVAAA